MYNIKVKEIQSATLLSVIYYLQFNLAVNVCWLCVALNGSNL